MLYIRLIVEFQDARDHREEAVIGPLDSERARRDWKDQFHGLLDQLNRELDLGWRSCISPTYEDFQTPRPPRDANSWTPEQAISWTEAAHEDAADKL